MVNMSGLQAGVTGLVAVVLTVAMGVVILDNLEGQTALTGMGANVTNTTTPVRDILGNGTQLVGDVILVWGTIILLGLVVVFIFVGILAALNFLTNRDGR